MAPRLSLTLSLLVLSCLALCNAYNKVIFVSFDGFRHDYIEKAQDNGRNVSCLLKIRENGFQAEVQNVMITHTFPSHFAMATGRYVENHGLVANEFYDPKLNLSYNYHSVYSTLNSAFYEYGGVEPLWLTNERVGKTSNGKAGGRSAVFLWVGSEPRINNHMAFATAGVYSTRYKLRWRVDRLIDWMSKDVFTLGMLYYNQPDSKGHTFGPDSVEVLDAIEEVNDGVCYLLQKIEQTPLLKDKVNLIITADHGMANVDPENVTTIYDKLDLNCVILDPTPSTIGIWPNPGHVNCTNKSITVEDIYKNLTDTPLKNVTVYKKEDIPDHYHYKRNYRIAPILLVADINWMIQYQEQPYTNLKGMHGYDNRLSDMHPFMLAMGPDIPQFEERQQFYQIDLYPYICALLGLDKPNKIDGLIDRTLKFMKNPPSEEFLEQFRLYASGALVPDWN